MANCGPEAASLCLLPSLWYRNTWIWGCKHEGCWLRPTLKAVGAASLQGDHVGFGRHYFVAGPGPTGRLPQWLFTENETNTRKLYGVDNWTPYAKDAFHEYLVQGRTEAVNPKAAGTKAGALYRLDIPAQGEVSVRLRLATHELSQEVSRTGGG